MSPELSRSSKSYTFFQRSPDTDRIMFSPDGSIAAPYFLNRVDGHETLYDRTLAAAAKDLGITVKQLTERLDQGEQFKW